MENNANISCSPLELILKNRHVTICRLLGKIWDICVYLYTYEQCFFMFCVLIRSSLNRILKMDSRMMWAFVYLLLSNTTVRVDMTQQNLTSVPQDMNELVTKLDLSINKIDRITNSSLVQYRELRKLIINNNGLKYIEDRRLITTHCSMNWSPNQTHYQFCPIRLD